MRGKKVGEGGYGVCGLKMLDTENNFGTLGLTVLQERRWLEGAGGGGVTKEMESAVSSVPTSDITMLIISAVVYVA